MNVSVKKFVVSVFGNYVDVNDSPNILKKIKEFLANQDLILYFENQIRYEIKTGPNIQPVPSQVVIRKPCFVDFNQIIRIAFKDDRIDLIFNPSRNELSDEVISLWVDVFLKILDKFQLVVNRVALSVAKIFDGEKTECAKIEMMFLSTDLDFLDRDKDRGWEVRLIEREHYPDFKVPININMAARKLYGKIETKLNEVEMYFDINTALDSGGYYNFENAEIGKYIAKLRSILEEETKKVEGKINVQR